MQKEPTIHDVMKSLRTIECAIAAKDKKSLSTEEAAVFLGVTVKSLQDLTHKKLIPYYKPNGKMMYFDKAELEDWLHRNRQTPVYEEGAKL